MVFEPLPPSPPGRTAWARAQGLGGGEELWPSPGHALGWGGGRGPGPGLRPGRSVELGLGRLPAPSDLRSSLLLASLLPRLAPRSSLASLLAPPSPRSSLLARLAPRSSAASLLAPRAPSFSLLARLARILFVKSGDSGERKAGSELEPSGLPASRGS